MEEGCVERECVEGGPVPVSDGRTRHLRESESKRGGTRGTRGTRGGGHRDALAYVVPFIRHSTSQHG